MTAAAGRLPWHDMREWQRVLAPLPTLVGIDASAGAFVYTAHAVAAGAELMRGGRGPLGDSLARQNVHLFAVLRE